jgi:hypothetical protein
MDRIEQIKKHLSIADGEEKSVNHHRWEASRLIWEEIEEGASRRELGKAIGKSHTHVRYMYNCWAIVGSKLPESQRPSFQDTYMSPEVRGENGEDEERDRSGSGDRKRDRREPEGDYTAHGQVNAAWGAIDALQRNKAYHQLLTEEDIDRIRQLPSMIRALLREIG